MEHEQDIIKRLFKKETIADRFHLPMDRIDILIEECGMPFEDEETFATWFSKEENSRRFLEEMEKFGAIAQWKASMNHPHHPSISYSPQEI